MNLYDVNLFNPIRHPAYNNLEQKDYFDRNLNEILVLHQKLSERIDAFLHDIQGKIEPKIEFIFAKAKELLKEYLEVEGDNAGKGLDLYFCINTIFHIIATQPQHAWTQKISEFIKLRENVLCGDSLDYCKTLSLAHYFCAHLAKNFVPHSGPVSSVLLNQALTKDRKTPWRDYQTLSEELPVLPGDYLRTIENKIHPYKGILRFAIMKLNEGETDPAIIWRGVDTKNDQMRLSASEINMIRQRTPTFKKLVDYVNLLFERSNEIDSIYERFVHLRAALLKGDAEHDGDEENAGPAAIIGVADFANWWNDLRSTPDGRHLHEQIKSLSNGDLGRVINVILNTSDNLDTSFCIVIKGSMLDRVLNENPVKEALQKLDKQILWRKSKDELNDLKKQILTELKTSSPQIINTPNIFQSLAANSRFMENILNDESVDYPILFQTANRSILWFETADHQLESSLSFATEKQNNEGFIEYLINYHGNCFSQSTLAHALTSLFKRHLFSTAKLLLEKYPQLPHLEADEEKNTPLHITVSATIPNMQLIKLLCATGDDITKQNIHGHTPFYIALKKKNQSVINYFINHYLDKIPMPELIKTMEFYIRTEQYQFAKVLLHKKPELIFASNHFMRTLCFNGDPDMELIKLFAKNPLNFTAKGPHQLICIEIATKEKHYGLVKYFLENHADKFPALALGSVLLQLCRDQQHDLIKLLLTKRPDTDRTLFEAYQVDYMTCLAEQAPPELRLDPSYLKRWENTKVASFNDALREVLYYPIHYILSAVEDPDLELIQLLLARQPILEQTLKFACLMHHDNVATLLLQNYGPFNTEELAFVIKKWMSNGNEKLSLLALQHLERFSQHLTSKEQQHIVKTATRSTNNLDIISHIVRSSETLKMFEKQLHKSNNFAHRGVLYECVQRGDKDIHLTRALTASLIEKGIEIDNKYLTKILIDSCATGIKTTNYFINQYPHLFTPGQLKSLFHRALQVNKELPHPQKLINRQGFFDRRRVKAYLRDTNTHRDQHSHHP